VNESGWRDQILAPEELPLKYVAHTPCFRSEAGASGKDTRGMIQQLQIRESGVGAYRQAGSVVRRARGIDRACLEGAAGAGIAVSRHFVKCAGDVGFSSAKTYDLEVWLPRSSAYREISSMQHCESFPGEAPTGAMAKSGDRKPEFGGTP